MASRSGAGGQDSDGACAARAPIGGCRYVSCPTRALRQRDVDRRDDRQARRSTRPATRAAPTRSTHHCRRSAQHLETGSDQPKPQPRPASPAHHPPTERYALAKQEEADHSSAQWDRLTSSPDEDDQLASQQRSEATWADTVAMCPRVPPIRPDRALNESSVWLDRRAMVRYPLPGPSVDSRSSDAHSPPGIPPGVGASSMDGTRSAHMPDVDGSTGRCDRNQAIGNTPMVRRS